MRPGEILDAQADLIMKVRNPSGAYRGYLDSMVIANHVTEDRYPVGSPARNRIRDQVCDAIATMAEAAYAYRVTPDMCSLVRFAASQLDDSDTFDRNLAPTGCGIVRFEDPLPVKDIRGRTMLLSWVVWGPLSVRDSGKDGVALWQFNDGWTHPDEIHDDFWNTGEVEGYSAESLDRLRREIGRWETIGMELVDRGAALGPELVDPSPEQAAEMAAEGVDALPGTNVRRLVHALWLLLGQTVVAVEDEAVDRPARRRAGRMRIPPRVTVIRLRRAENSHRAEGESHVEWQHRWIVRGHWRWQPCGVGRSERRRIWIHPFVKGPEDAPLKQSEKLYSLDR